MSQHGPSRRENFGKRMALVRESLGFEGRGTSRRTFAEEIGVNPATYNGWEARDHFPGSKKLVDAFSRMFSVKTSKADPAELATWCATGLGRPPFTVDARSAAALGIVWQPEPGDPAPTPPSLPAVPLPAQLTLREDDVAFRAIIIEPESAYVRALEAIDKGEDPRPILEFALETLRKMKTLTREARRLGLAQILTATGITLTMLLGGVRKAEASAFHRSAPAGNHVFRGLARRKNHVFRRSRGGAA